MNVALIGSGGREHAIAWKLKQSPQLTELFILPGNPGTAELGKNIRIEVNDSTKILEFCKENKIDLIIIGPEQPLVNGLTDLLENSGFKVFGPTSRAARIEGDKSYAKNLMMRNLIPTADFNVFKKDQITDALKYLEVCKYPTVIKATGLAAGKGVIICNNFDEAQIAIENCFTKNKFGKSGETIVIEEFLEGEEASVFAITDGTDFVVLPVSQDHKRAYDNDMGPNTGGMGAYAPAKVVDSDLISEIEKTIIEPTLSALKNDSSVFVGCLYCGLMLTAKGPKVIEFNCRFGDPETQVVLPLLEGDFLELLSSAANKRIAKKSVTYNNGSAVCVITTSAGYPGSYQNGYEITGLEKITDNHIIKFHAGTKLQKEKIVTNGGRVLGITSFIKSNDISECIKIVYSEIPKIHYTGITYRKDIGRRAVLH
ncbi:MAG: phosphoribosylamine--glycine ligase [bacterium]